MRPALVVVAAMALGAAPASADLNVVYKGTESFGDKPTPAEARCSIAKGRAVMVQKGSMRARMVFLQKEGVLRVIDDSQRTYVDMDRAMMDDMSGMAASAKAQMDEGMAKLSPEQRKMMESMMGQRLQQAAPVADKFVRSDETATIKGYPCTRVDVMRGPDKKAEYWGTLSKDFQMSADEKQTLTDMQAFMAGFVNSMTPLTGKGAGGVRGFQFDAAVAGYPIVTRCFTNGKKILDLTMDSFDRDAAPDSLFALPKGYTKQDLSGLGKMRGKPPGDEESPKDEGQGKE